MTHHQIMILLYSFKIVGRTAFPQFLIIQNPTTPCYFRLPKYIAYGLTIASIVYAYFQPLSQAFHDKIAKTVVVSEK